MKNIFKLFNKKAQECIPCNHNQNYLYVRWINEDGTPMMTFRCNDCGNFDKGHVYGESKDWVGTTKCVNGVPLEIG